MNELDKLRDGFRSEGFAFVRKWWRTNWWRSLAQSAETKKTFDGLLSTSVLASPQFSLSSPEDCKNLANFALKRATSSCIQEMLKIVAEKNDTQMLEVFLPHIQSKNINVAFALNKAADLKHWGVVGRLNTYDQPHNPLNATLKIAAASGNLEVVKALIPFANATKHGDAFVSAAAQGHLPVIHALLPHIDEQWLHIGLVEAVARSQTPIVEALVDRLSIASLALVRAQACNGGYNDGSELWEKRKTPNPETLEVIDRYILREKLSLTAAETAKSSTPSRRKM